MAFFVGIDGCRGGWFSVSLRDDFEWELNIFSNVKYIWDSVHQADIILIDIPIGLRDKGSKQRLCDIEARGILGSPRASSVFTPPARGALLAETREEASKINYSLTGRRIGAQMWGIVPKIREVDQFLGVTPSAKNKVREIHPEVLFWALNRHTAMKYRKKGLEGFLERLQVLRMYFPDCDELVIQALTEFQRNVLEKDDILDALAAAVTGLVGNKDLITVPKDPEKDAVGLSMEMVVSTYDESS